MPPETPIVDNSSELEAIISQNVEIINNGNATNEILENLLVQNDSNNLKESIDTLLSQNQDMLDVAKETRDVLSTKSDEKVIVAISDLKPEFNKVSTTLAGVGKVLEELAKIRGSRFLGVFKTKDDLPTEGIQEGDFALLEDNGELWYV